MRAKQALENYIKQMPEENCKMFEDLDKQNKGTYFYPWWWNAREKLK